MACSLSTGILTVDCMDGVGGIASVRIAEKASIDTITRSDQRITAISMESGDYFYYFAIDQEKASATSVETKNVANGTVSWVHTLQSTWRKLSYTKANIIRVLAQNPALVAIVEDNNGNYLMLGYNLGGHITGITGSTGAAIGDANGYDFTFTANDKHDWYYVDSSVISGITDPAS